MPVSSLPWDADIFIKSGLRRVQPNYITQMFVKFD